MATMTYAPTLAQIPRRSKDYYEESIRSDLFEFHYIGRDDAGRRIYQRYFNGSRYGAPRALLSYREFKSKVETWAKRCSSIGIQRWTEPFFLNPE